MGNSLSTAIGYFILYVIKLKEHLDSYINKPQDKNLFSNDIILGSDEEQKAGKKY